ncbi:MAG: GNAT family N-acetyltransferase [Bacteroidales bacterium]|jgi:predicted acetyltransferase|nr:GNAT family N-acetyltransferase [Bacteroidales bacterium]
MITYAKTYQKQDIIQLWKISFPEDSPEFVNLYFKEKYERKNTLVYKIENKIISCLQMLPYCITFYNHICKTSYISGAATHPDYRNKGFMGKLITQSLWEMKNKGSIFSILIPQTSGLKNFYQKYGYFSCFEYAINQVMLPKAPLDLSTMSIVEMDAVNIREAYIFYDELCNRKKLFVLKTFNDFRIIWEDLKLAAGSVFLCYDAEKISGICFCFDQGEKIIIKDIFRRKKAAKTALLNHVVTQYPEKKIYASSPIINTKKKGHTCTRGMARILDVKQALQLYALSHTDLKITIKVNDKQIAENNGIFHVSNGDCIQQNNGDFDCEVSINMLTRLLFGYHTDELPPVYNIFTPKHPYMSLMLD